MINKGKIMEYKNTIPQYPMLEIDLHKIKHNINTVVDICQKRGIQVTGVVKGFHAIPEMIEVYGTSNCTHLGTSRMEQMKQCKAIAPNIPTMMLRIPMLCEIEQVVTYADCSLNSEISTLVALDKEAGRQCTTHDVILMTDLGDLREGFWGEDQLVTACNMVERELPNLHLLGIGTNLGCYGSVQPTINKMEELTQVAVAVETAIGRELELISGGGTTSFPLVYRGVMPEKINHLRIGEGLCLTYDYGTYFGIDTSFLHQDGLLLKAQIIEIKDKPSHPVGEVDHDAFGHYPTYVDRGIRRRALLAMGKVDFGETEMIFARNKKVEILGGSSDHLILDIENCKDELHIGDILEFELSYLSMVYATCSQNLYRNILPVH